MSQAKVMGDKGANGPNAKLSKSGAVFDSVNTTSLTICTRPMRYGRVQYQYHILSRGKRRCTITSASTIMPHLFEINHVVS